VLKSEPILKTLRDSDPAKWDQLQLNETGRWLMPAMESCVVCHNPAGTVNHKASANCSECHYYHERTTTAVAATAQAVP
jgi:hypothetical protein